MTTNTQPVITKPDVAELGITVDDRQARTHPRTSIVLKAKTKITITRLNFADYAFIAKPIGELQRPTVGIEMCTLDDLLGKMGKSRRFKFQTTGMIERYDVRIWMVQGLMIPNAEGYVRTFHDKSGMYYKAAMSLIFGAEMRGVKFEFYSNQKSLDEQLLQHYLYLQKDPSEHSAFRPTTPKNIPTMPLDAALAPHVETLMSYPGVGEDKAISALKKFGSIQMLHIVPPEKLLEIPLWGKVVAEAFHRHITERPLD